MEEYKGYKLYFEDRNYKKILEDIIRKKFSSRKRI